MHTNLLLIFTSAGKSYTLSKYQVFPFFSAVMSAGLAITLGLLYPLDLRCSTYAAFALTSDFLLLFIKSNLLLVIVLHHPRTRLRGIPVSLLEESAKWYVFGFTPFAFVRTAVEIRTSHVPPNGHLLIIIQREQASSF